MGIYKRNHAGCELGSMGIRECSEGNIPTTYSPVMQFIEKRRFGRALQDC